jgi:Ca2+/Na+ antiporter
MNAAPDYKRFQFPIADLLGLMVIVALLATTSGPINPLSPASELLFMLRAILLIAVLYLGRFRILSLQARPWIALSLYLLLVAALVPYLYYCVFAVGSPNSPHPINPLAQWIGIPITAYTVPTAFFLHDIFRHKRPSLKFYGIRSLLEIVIVIPLWAFVWWCIEFMCLNWI